MDQFFSKNFRTGSFCGDSEGENCRNGNHYFDHSWFSNARSIGLQPVVGPGLDVTVLEGLHVANYSWNDICDSYNVEPHQEIKRSSSSSYKTAACCKLSTESRTASSSTNKTPQNSNPVNTIKSDHKFRGEKSQHSLKDDHHKKHADNKADLAFTVAQHDRPGHVQEDNIWTDFQQKNPPDREFVPKKPGDSESQRGFRDYQHQHSNRTASVKSEHSRTTNVNLGHNKFETGRNDVQQSIGKMSPENVQSHRSSFSNPDSPGPSSSEHSRRRDYRSPSHKSDHVLAPYIPKIKTASPNTSIHLPRPSTRQRLYIEPTPPIIHPLSPQQLNEPLPGWASSASAENAPSLFSLFYPINPPPESPPPWHPSPTSSSLQSIQSKLSKKSSAAMEGIKSFLARKSGERKQFEEQELQTQRSNRSSKVKMNKENADDSKIRNSHKHSHAFETDKVPTRMSFKDSQTTENDQRNSRNSRNIDVEDILLSHGDSMTFEAEMREKEIQTQQQRAWEEFSKKECHSRVPNIHQSKWVALPFKDTRPLYAPKIEQYSSCCLHFEDDDINLSPNDTVPSEKSKSTDLNGRKKMKTMWAVTRISFFDDESRTYEIMTPTNHPPEKVPTVVEGIFLFKPPKLCSNK